MKYCLLALSAAILASCTISMPQPVNQPQNRDEFKGAVAKGARFMKVETYVAKRPFDDAIKLVRTKTGECLNYRLTETERSVATGLTTYTSAHDYAASFRAIGKTRAELTMQHNPRGTRIGPEMPQGGFYLIAVDFERASANTTQLTLYGPTMGGWDRTYDAIKKWSEGIAVACPKR
jgi:hypothetical protein